MSTELVLSPKGNIPTIASGFTLPATVADREGKRHGTDINRL